MYTYLMLAVLAVASAEVTESYKDQYCTDPRTMRKHAAYSEWADAYSCTRHRCQPGGRNLAIYTVGCKRVEAPESAIECEEVVEDTNMQFPFCCTRLRCLVVVRGEVWTRVLGQPWETLPAAPWSHMYKMKKPPPSDDTFLTKNVGPGPIYELQAEHANGDQEHDKVLRASHQKQSTNGPDCKDTDHSIHRAVPAPDIVIALTTGNDDKVLKKAESSRLKEAKTKSSNTGRYQEENSERERAEAEFEEAPVSDKAPETSDEKYFPHAFGVTQKVPEKQVSWNEVPQNQWNEHEPSMDAENTPQPHEEKNEKSGLQALVDAIGNRMRDIENVVQRMSEKVIHTPQADFDNTELRAKHKPDHKDAVKESAPKLKKPNPDGEHYKRFSVRARGSKYLRGSTDVTTELPLYVEDTSLNGYFSDASNSLVRRSNSPKEPALTYMAPVENQRKSSQGVPNLSEEKKHKKHTHKRKRGKGKGHKKHHEKEEKKKHFNKLNSLELDKSVDDTSAIVNI